MDYLEEFQKYLIGLGKSRNTVSQYKYSVQLYLRWYDETFGLQFIRLIRQNILEYKSFLQNTKKTRGKNLDAKSINNTICSIMSFNRFLISEGMQDDVVINKNDLLRVQRKYVNPANIAKKDVEQLIQKMLIDENIRDVAVVCLLAYAGLRVSEALDLKLGDIDLNNKELTVRNGKGSKQRKVFFNEKVARAVTEYLESRESDSLNLFVSRVKGNLNRTVVYKNIKKYSNDKISPHSLRHFYCQNCLMNGFKIHEVSILAGHSDIRTTMQYLNPNTEELKRKVELL